MFRRKGRVDLLGELSALSIGDEEAAFMYLDYSGVIVRTVNRMVAFDVADLLKSGEVKALRSLGLLLYTHGHGDHYTLGEAVEISGSTGASVVAEPMVAEALRGKIPPNKLTSAIPGKTYAVGGFEISTVRGIHRGPINLYLVKMGEVSIFHGGDSGYVPLKGHRADLAFLPTGSPSPTASPDYALRMALELKPKVVVAIHGSEAQSKEFQKKVMEEMPETTTIIPEPYSTRRVSLRKKT